MDHAYVTPATRSRVMCSRGPKEYLPWMGLSTGICGYIHSHVEAITHASVTGHDKSRISNTLYLQLDLATLALTGSSIQILTF